MKKRLHNKTAIFILFVFALFANELTAQLTFTANPTTVTEFTIDRGTFNTGTTTLTWSGTGVAKTVVTHSNTLTSGGGTPRSESLVSAKGAGGSQNFPWVRVGYTHTFRVYEGTQADFNNGTLGDLLATVVVKGDKNGKK